MSVHSVNQEGLQRLQSLINGSHWLNQNQDSKQRSKSRDDLEEDEKKSSNDEGKETNAIKQFHKSFFCQLWIDFDLLFNELLLFLTFNVIPAFNNGKLLEIKKFSS